MRGSDCIPPPPLPAGPPSAACRPSLTRRCPAAAAGSWKMSPRPPPTSSSCWRSRAMGKLALTVSHWGGGGRGCGRSDPWVCFGGVLPLKNGARLGMKH